MPHFRFRHNSLSEWILSQALWWAAFSNIIVYPPVSKSFHPLPNPRKWWLGHLLLSFLLWIECVCLICHGPPLAAFLRPLVGQSLSLRVRSDMIRFLQLFIFFEIGEDSWGLLWRRVHLALCPKAIHDSNSSYLYWYSSPLILAYSH